MVDQEHQVVGGLAAELQVGPLLGIEVAVPEELLGAHDAIERGVELLVEVIEQFSPVGAVGPLLVQVPTKLEVDLDLGGEGGQDADLRLRQRARIVIDDAERAERMARWKFRAALRCRYGPKKARRSALS